MTEQIITSQMYQALQLLRKSGNVLTDERFFLEFENLPDEPRSYEEGKKLVGDLLEQELMEERESDLFNMFVITENGEAALDEFLTAAKQKQ